MKNVMMVAIARIKNAHTLMWITTKVKWSFISYVKVGLNGKKYGHTKGASGLINTDKYENMRLLFLEFSDSASDEVDEEAWNDKLTMLDELLAEVIRLQKYKRAFDRLYEMADADSDWKALIDELWEMIE